MIIYSISSTEGSDTFTHRPRPEDKQSGEADKNQLVRGVKHGTFSCVEGRVVGVQSWRIRSQGSVRRGQELELSFNAEAQGRVTAP